MTPTLRLARLAVVTFAAGTLAYGAASAGGAQSAVVRPVFDGAATLRVQLDGLHVGTVAATGTVGEALERLGLAATPTDRVSADLDAAVVPGMHLMVDRGFPVTLIDGGQMVPARSRATTVGGFLAALAVPIGDDDLIADALERNLQPGDVVKVMRVVERQLTEVNTYPFRVRSIDDAGLDSGRQVVDARGQAGEVSETYTVRYIDGIEAERTLVSAIVLRSPVTEVRRIGIRPVAPPPPPKEIDSIIRAAAAQHGADPEQLIRVAWCESKFNPDAYNPSHGDSGLFQFIPPTWAANSVRAGYAGASPFDPVASANVAAWMFGRGQAWQWSCK